MAIIRARLPFVPGARPASKIYRTVRVLVGAWGVFHEPAAHRDGCRANVGQGFSIEILGAHTYTLGPLYLLGVRRYDGLTPHVD